MSSDFLDLQETFRNQGRNGTIVAGGIRLYCDIYVSGTTRLQPSIDRMSSDERMRHMLSDQNLTQLHQKAFGCGSHDSQSPKRRASS